MMKLFPKALTDDEFVAAARKWSTRTKWRALHEGGIGVLLLGFFFFVLHLVEKHLLFAGEAYEWLPAGLRIGILLGTMLALLLVVGVLQLGAAINVFSGNRVVRLMLQYHDVLEKKALSANSGAGKTSRSVATESLPGTVG